MDARDVLDSRELRHPDAENKRRDDKGGRGQNQFVNDRVYIGSGLTSTVTQLRPMNRPSSHWTIRLTVARRQGNPTASNAVYIIGRKNERHSQ